MRTSAGMPPPPPPSHHLANHALRTKLVVVVAGIAAEAAKTCWILHDGGVMGGSDPPRPVWQWPNVTIVGRPVAKLASADDSK